MYQGTETTHLEPQQEGDRLEEKQQPQPKSPQTGGKAAIWTQIRKDRDAARAENGNCNSLSNALSQQSGKTGYDRPIGRMMITRFEGTESVVTEGRYQWEVVAGSWMQA